MGGSGMRLYRPVVLALALVTAINAGKQNACAQQRINYRYAQSTAPASSAPAKAPTAAPLSTAPAIRGTTEELPMGQSAPAQYSGSMESGGYYDGSGSPYCSCETCGPSCGCQEMCGDPCCSCECGQSCGSGCCESNSFCGLRGGTWFVTADYLNVRAHFSDALAFVRQVDTNTTPSTTTQHFEQIDFDPESSFRVGGGYRLCNCG